MFSQVRPNGFKRKYFSPVSEADLHLSEFFYQNIKSFSFLPVKRRKQSVSLIGISQRRNLKTHGKIFQLPEPRSLVFVPDRVSIEQQGVLHKTKRLVLKTVCM